MGLGTITRYKIGHVGHGVRVSRIFPERVSKHYKTGIYKYYPTTYYIIYDIGRGVGPEPWMLEEYQLNTLLSNLERCWDTHKRKGLHKMLDKKYESCKRKRLHKLQSAFVSKEKTKKGKKDS